MYTPLFTQDDCAPDSLAFFERELVKETGMTIAEFKSSSYVECIDDMTTQFIHKNYKLSWAYDDPFYVLLIKE